MANPLTVLINEDGLFFRLHLLDPSLAPLDIDALHLKVGEYSNNAGLSDKEVFAVNIGLEELISNIAKFGCAPGAMHSDLTVTGEVRNGPSEVCLTLCDNGAAFDPEEAPEPELDLELSQRAIGGLGLFMLKQIFTRHSYVRQDGWNRNTWELARSIRNSQDSQENI